MREDMQLSSVQEYVFRHAYFFDEMGVVVVGVPKAGSTSLLAGFFAHEGKDPLALLELAVSEEAEWDQGLWSCAGTLRGLLGNRNRKVAQSILSDRGIRKVAFVRHPLSRLLSSWISKLLVAEPYFSEIARQSLGACFDTTAISKLTPLGVAQLLVSSCRKVLSSEWFMADQHFSPQAHLLEWLPSSAEVLDVSRMDGEMHRLLPDSWPRIRRLNTTAGVPGIPITPEFVDLVRTAYAADFQRYGHLFADVQPVAAERLSESEPWLPPDSCFLAHIRAARRLAPWVEAARLREPDPVIAERDEALAAQARLLEERWVLVQDLEKRIGERDETIASQAKMIEERWSIMEDGQRAIAERDEALAAQARLLEKRWVLVQDLEKRIGERDETIASQAKMIEERWSIMEDGQRAIAERDEALAAQARLLEERRLLVQDMEKRIEERDETIASQAKILEERWSIMEDGCRTISERYEALAAQARLLEERWLLVQDLEKRIGERDETLTSRLKVIEERCAIIEDGERAIAERDEALATQARQLEERWSLLQDLEKRIAEHDQTIANQSEVFTQLRFDCEEMREKMRAQEASVASYRRKWSNSWLMSRRLVALWIGKGKENEQF
jgi:hypothetical protein